MINGILYRNFFCPKKTFGNLALFEDGKQFFECYTCEDVVRGDGNPNTVSGWKIKDDSAIPYGRYKCVMTLSNRLIKYTWQLLDVPGFDDVRIYAGKHTEGCLVFGKHISPNYDCIVGSIKTVSLFEDMLRQKECKDFILKVANGLNNIN